jgi:hypothetical protein
MNDSRGLSVYIDGHIFIPDPRVNHEAGAVTKVVEKLNIAVLPQVSSLSVVSDALQQLFRALARYRRPLNLLIFTIHNNDRRLSNLQLQPVRSVGVDEVK